MGEYRVFDDVRGGFIIQMCVNIGGFLWDNYGQKKGEKVRYFCKKKTRVFSIFEKIVRRGLAIALTSNQRAKKGEKWAPWSHFSPCGKNIPPDPEKFKGGSRAGVGGA